MPTDALLMTIAVVAVFVGFGVVLAWGDRQTKGLNSSEPGKR